MALGQYELALEEALKKVSDGPWTETDLDSVPEIATDDFCEKYAPDCSSAALLDWLRSLDQREREEVLARINADRDQKRRT